MTIRAATLDRVPTELLLERLRKAPDCPVTMSALERRGALHLATEVVRAEQADRELEAAGPAVVDLLYDAMAGVNGGLA